VVSFELHGKLCWSSFALSLKIDELFLEIHPDEYEVVGFKIPSHDLFTVEDCQTVMEADGRRRVVAVLTKQICSAFDAITIRIVFVLD
jgi:hypothetical protein